MWDASLPAPSPHLESAVSAPLPRPALALFTAASIGVAAVAQTPPCASLNDTNNRVFGGVTGASGQGTRNRRAFEITPAAGVTAQSIRILTQSARMSQLSSPPFMALELWTDSGGQPGRRLAGGTWYVYDARALSWQGANLDAPVPLAANTTYWLVWTEPGWSVPPTEPNGTWSRMLVWTGAAWQLLGFEAIKYRIYCGLLDDTGVQTAGSPCSSAAGRIGTLFTNEAPTTANVFFAVEGSGFPAGATGFVLLGTDPNYQGAPHPLLPPGCGIHTDVLVAAGLVTGTGPNAGHLRFGLPVPASPGLIGVFLGVQAGAVDGAAVAPIPVVTSNALRVTIY